MATVNPGALNEQAVKQALADLAALLQQMLAEKRRTDPQGAR